MSNEQVQMGPYLVLRQIGRGGMASVYQAIDQRNGRELALKILLPQYYNDRTYLRRFAKEGLNARRLVHPHIVRTYDCGQEAGYHFIAMELVDSGTLDQYIKRCGGKLTVEQSMTVLRQIGTALDYAHGLGYIHRDIKLNNILRSRDGRFLLSDFGVSKHLSSDYTMMTGIGQSIGTPSFMSPEQARGDRSVDHRSDIYGFGVIAYKLLTGGLPFTAEDAMELTHKIIFYEPVPPQEINPDLPGSTVNALTQVLSKHPDARFASCAELIQALERKNRNPLKLVANLFSFHSFRHWLSSRRTQTPVVPGNVYTSDKVRTKGTMKEMLSKIGHRFSVGDRTEFPAESSNADAGELSPTTALAVREMYPEQHDYKVIP